MMHGGIPFGGYRTMWIIAAFDLPVDTEEARRCYREFRKVLLNDGFMMWQYSIYARHCSSNENADVHERRISAFLPPAGQVRVFILTDKQVERMRVFHGIRRFPAENAPEQLTFL